MAKTSQVTPAEVPASPTAQELQHQSNIKMQELAKRRAETYKKYKNEEKIPVIVSPFYRAYFGSVMPVIINGFPIYVPVDGKQYKIPRTYADVVNERIMNIDKIITRANRLADVQANKESYIGELNIL